jgi:hypothetical protein
MSTPVYRITVRSDEAELIDYSGLANELLTRICLEQKLHPIAVITAALVLLKQQKV